MAQKYCFRDRRHALRQAKKRRHALRQARHGLWSVSVSPSRSDRPDTVCGLCLCLRRAQTGQTRPRRYCDTEQLRLLGEPVKPARRCCDTEQQRATSCVMKDSRKFVSFPLLRHGAAEGAVGSATAVPQTSRCAAQYAQQMFICMVSVWCSLLKPSPPGITPPG